MKKLLLISAFIATTISLSAQSAIETWVYDVTVTGTVGGTSTNTGTGFAVVSLDPNSLGTTGTLSMTVDNVVTAPGNVFTFTATTTGTFTPSAVQATNHLAFLGSGATMYVNSCTPTSGPGCNYFQPGSSSTFTIDPGTFSYGLSPGFAEFTVTTPALASINVSRYVLTQADPAVVPVPAAAWLFGTALVGIASIGRRRTSK